MSQSRGRSTERELLYWRGSLLAGAVVIGVVALLLHLLARTVERIEAGVAEIWQAGKLVANNTVHIPLLGRTNQIAAQLLQRADGIARATGRIRLALTRSKAEG